jgi:hypothetical protein
MRRVNASIFRSPGPEACRALGLEDKNPHARSQEDRRTPEELLDLVEARGREVAEAVAALRALRSQGAP